MGQILTLDNIISIVEIKSSSDMQIYPVSVEPKQIYYNPNKIYNPNNEKYNPDKIHNNPEYAMDCILNVELIEEPIIAKYIEDKYGIILDAV